MQKFPMTVGGAEQLRQELLTLKSVERPKVVNAISEARKHGDLKENAEYHAAKEQQGFIEGRIREVEAKLSLAQIIDVKELKPDGKVVFGATVTLINLDSDKKVTYQIVGEDEANIKINKISVTAPIARAAIGKFEGDIIEVQAPGGVVSYEVLDVIYE